MVHLGSIQALDRSAPGEKAAWLRLALVVAFCGYATCSVADFVAGGWPELVASTDPYVAAVIVLAFGAQRAGRRPLSAFLLLGAVGIEIVWTLHTSESGVRSAATIAIVPFVTGVALLFGLRAGLVVSGAVAGVALSALATGPTGPGLPARDLSVVVTVVFSVAAMLLLTRAFHQATARTYAIRQKSADRFRELVEESPDALLWFDGSGHLEGLTAAARQLLALPRSTAMGELFGGLPLATVEGDTPTWPLAERVPTLLKLRGEDRFFEATRRQVTREDGRRGALVSLRDVTTRVKAERQASALREELEAARKMAAVARVAGGVAHDVNNLLAALMGQAEYLKHAPPHEVEPLVGDCLETLERGATLTKRLLTATGRFPTEPEVVDLAPWLMTVTPGLEELVPDGMSLVVETRRDGCIRVDGKQLEQALRELVTNAVEAARDGGEVHLGCDATDDEVVLEVRDEGTGMTTDVRTKALEPFFTTKARGRATGLGLSLVHGLAVASGGRVELESTEGKGTRVGLVWPRYQPEDAEDHVASAFEPSPVRGRILVVDDLPDTLRSVARMLRRHGHRVDVAATAEDAMNRLAGAMDEGTPVDLLLTDVLMPGTHGPELARRARTVDPRLAVLFMTGYADEIMSLDEGLERADLLMKPFGASALLERVGTLLAHRRRLSVTPPTGLPSSA